MLGDLDCSATGVWEAESPAPAVADDDELGIGASKSSLVTLKQGTCRLNFWVSTNVYSSEIWSALYPIVSRRLWVTYDVGTGEERLIIPAVLTLELRPIFQLNRSVGTRRNTFKSIDLVTLMARIDICYVVHNLVIEVGLGGWIYGQPLAHLSQSA